GWARRGNQSDSNIASDIGLTQNPNLQTRVSREVSSTVRSSQSASDAVDRLIDAINNGKIPINQIDDFSRSSSPDLFGVDEHAESVASTSDTIFCNQTKDDWCSTPFELNYFSSQPPMYHSREHSEPESHYSNSCFWFPSQPDLQSSLKSCTHRNSQSRKTDNMNPFLTKAENVSPVTKDILVKIMH
ncbi:hypothetical protein FBUS_08769, partial [Fasciolopsis buskii]